MLGLSIINSARDNRGGFLKDTEIPVIASDPETRLQLVLVRCGNGRFLAPAQDVAHFIAIIERDGSDYIRDVSLPATTSK